VAGRLSRRRRLLDEPVADADDGFDLGPGVAELRAQPADVDARSSATMRYRLNVLVLVGVALLSAYFMASAYWRARDDAIDQLTAQERILAGQAAQGITEYFSHYRQMLEFLAKSPEVVQNNDRGERLLRDLFLSQGGNLLAVTRVGSDGRILYTYPEEQAAGQNILAQPHVRTAFETRRPVVSQVFRSVQGFDCVALHVPVLNAGRFAGTLAVLVPFETISRQHVEGIRIGRSGHAILVSGEGIELYCLVPGHIRRSIRDTSREFPALSAMAGRMLRGETGTAVYEHNWVEGLGTRVTRKHAYFTPIRLENTFWSIAVTAPEEEALVFIRGFRNRWILGMTLLMIAFGVWGCFLARAMLQLHREETRRVAQEGVLLAEREREKALRDSEERFRTYFEDSLLAMAITSPGRDWLVVNERLTHLLGYSKEELKALTVEQLAHPDDVDTDRTQFARVLAGETDGYSREMRFVRRDWTIVHTIFSVRLVRGADGSPDYCLAQLQDIVPLGERGQGQPLRGSTGTEGVRLAAVGPVVEAAALLDPEAGDERRARERGDRPDRDEAEPREPTAHLEVTGECGSGERGEEGGVPARRNQDGRHGRRAGAGGGGERGGETRPGDPGPGRPREERSQHRPGPPHEVRLGAPERLEAVHLDLQRAEGPVGRIGRAGDPRAERSEGIEGSLDGRGVGGGVGREEDGLRREPVGLPEGDPPADPQGERSGAGVEDDAVIPRPPAEDQRPGGRDAGVALPREPESEVRPGEVEEAHRSIPGAPTR